MEEVLCIKNGIEMEPGSADCQSGLTSSTVIFTTLGICVVAMIFTGPISRQNGYGFASTELGLNYLPRGSPMRFCKRSNFNHMSDSQVILHLL